MELLEYFNNNNGHLIDKWIHYFDIYERHFSSFVNKKIKILEIGVYQGGSVKMWKNYFGKNATIIGVDINPKCKLIEDEQIKIYIGDQSDIKFLKSLIEIEHGFDIIIDDGGHYVHQQIISFRELYPFLNDGGVYLCEDLHTNYWKQYGGGYKSPNSFIEMSKNLIDELNAYLAWENDNKSNLMITEFTKTTTGIHYYDSVIVFDKKNKNKPTSKKTGNFKI